MSAGGGGMWAKVRGSTPTDLWLISYSDMLTLLIAFFVMILSFSTVNQKSFEQMRAAFNHTPMTEDQLNRLAEQVNAWIKRDGLQSQIVVTRDSDGLRVQLVNSAVFESGKATINPAGAVTINKIIHFISTVDTTYKVTIEGYSDDVPINNPQYHSNWALSSARAVEVLQRFIDAKVAKDRLSVAAYADTRPVDTKVPTTMSETEAKSFLRSLNRRVIIRVF